jgi:hypothetical protein
MKRQIKEDFAALDAHAHLALIFRDDAQDADTIGKMSRYEARFERSFYKALKELQRLQALRAAVSDSGNGTVSQDPVSPDPDPAPAPISDPLPDPDPAHPTAQASARGPEPAPQPEIHPASPADVDPHAVAGPETSIVADLPVGE